MADGDPVFSPNVAGAKLVEKLRQVLDAGRAGLAIDGVTFLNTEAQDALSTPAGIEVARVLMLDDALILVLTDGTLIVLLEALEHDFALVSNGQSVESAALLDIAQPAETWNGTISLGRQVTDGSAGSGPEVTLRLLDPLFGLDFNPLLLPVSYPEPERLEDRYGGREGPRGFEIVPLESSDIRLAETDGPVSFRLGDYFTLTSEVGTGDTSSAVVSVRIANLPVGTSASFGTFTLAENGLLVFEATGSAAQIGALLITLPADFSTDSRSDFEPGALQGTFHVTSRFGDDVSSDFTIGLSVEGDVALDGPGALELAEADGPVDFRPADALVPSATDADGSESVTTVSLELIGLPAGTLISRDGGVSFSELDDPFAFSGSPGDYAQLVVRLPTDFSTANPATEIIGTVTARTDEGGEVTRNFGVTLAYELDVDLSAPALIEAEEDSWGGDDSGVRLALGISVAATDMDGSEDSTIVEIQYSGVPPFAYFNGGSFDAGSGLWAGTMAEANALVLTLPGDYSGTITSIIRAMGPEGSTETGQTIRISPTGDIDFDVKELVAAETDAPVIVIPSSAWNVSISDDDPGEPSESLQRVTFTLEGLPPGVIMAGVPTSAITYDAVTGGTLSFSGTAEQYASLTLTFPADYSTESPLFGASGALTGRISATSSEDPTGGQNVPISLRITPEGDLVIRDLPDTVADETDEPTRVSPSELMLPEITDLDGSESLVGAVLVIEGLPAGSTLASLGLALPTGAQSLLDTLPNGTVTAYILLTQAQVGDVLQAYSALEFELPADFSTENRSDLSAGTSLPLTLRLIGLTDEEADLRIETADDGFAIAERVVDITAEADLTLDAPASLNGIEDGRAGDGTGVEVALGIDIAANDIDGSENDITVAIRFETLPAGTMFLNGGTDLTDRYDPATGIWQGSEAEAEALSLRFPGDYSGTVSLDIEARSPEGAVRSGQVIEITPAPDIDFGIEDAALSETDRPVRLSPSDVWQVEISDFDTNLPREELQTVTLTLDDMPPGVTVLNVPADTTTYDVASGGSLVFTGTAAQYSELLFVFPADFSTESRGPGQGTEGPITGTLSAVSTEGAATAGPPLSLTLTPEGDVRIDNTKPFVAPVETDGVTLIRAGDVIEAFATDVDGSESLEQLVLTIEGLPATDQSGAPLDPLPPVDGSYLLLNDGGGVAEFALAGDGTVTMTLTLDAASVGDVAAAYNQISFTLPQDFSTANRSDFASAGGATSLPLTFRLSARTDEDQDPGTDMLGDGEMTRQRTIEIGYELDVDLSVAESAITVLEDGDGADGGGVTIDLGISVAASDLDGSEDSTTVEIHFEGLPSGASFTQGSYDPSIGVWSGSMAEAEAVSLLLPGDFSTDAGAPITATVRAVSPEGSVEAGLSITVTPTGDIDLNVTELVGAETDAAVILRPADAWQASISDADGSEVIDTVTLTLSDLPADMQIATPLGGTVSYDEIAGGEFTFQGTYAQYAALTLGFPADFSTQSPLPGGAIAGTLSVASSEDSLGQTENVTLTISPEGDVGIDSSMSFADRLEDDATPIRPADLLAPVATDADGSEALQTLVLVVEGLPATDAAGAPLVDPIDPSYLQLSVDAGAVVTFARARDGAVTMTITLEEGPVTDIAAAYATISFVLPEDFSTENRIDIGAVPPDASLPLTFRLSAQTDEDIAAGAAAGPDADPGDGWAQVERVLHVSAQEDIDLVVPGTITAEEDEGLPDASDGVIVDLQIALSINDADGSETDDPNSAFAPTVRVLFLGLPDGSTFNGGVFDPATNLWSGTVAEVNALSVSLPGNYNGSFGTVVFVQTPEGTEIARQTVEITPTPDVIGGVIISRETDDILQIRIGDSLDIDSADGGNPAVTGITSVTITGLPYDGADPASNFQLLRGGAPVGVLAPDGTFTWTPAAPLTVAEAEDLVMVFPRDYSTENPATSPVATFGVEPTSEDAVVVPITVEAEGDVEVPNGTIALAEIDGAVTFRPADEVVPVATDVDGSESVTRITVVFNTLPEGMRISLDGVTSFTVASSDTLVLIGDAGQTALEQYADLVIELPQDFSTENPPTEFFALIGASTDESGFALGRLDVTVAAEEDLVLTGNGAIVQTENDVPGDRDEDASSQAPRDVLLSDAWDASVSDIDGSEVVDSIVLTLSNLPDGTLISTDGGLSFTALAGSGYSGTFATIEEYRAVILRLPDDFSTESRGAGQGTNGPITGNVTFSTDEGGLQSEPIAITVAPEADVVIEAADITQQEDYVGMPPVGQGQSIALGLDVEITDIDGSETLQQIDVSFSGLPADGTVISDGSTNFALAGPNDQIPGLTSAQLQALTLTGLPPHFSGIIEVTVSVQTNEGGATTETFAVNIEPVAEPVIDLSVDLASPEVTQDASGAYVVKEDTQFSLRIAASTPDTDGSEDLTQIVVENIPAGWLPSGDIPLNLLSGDTTSITSANLSGTTLTLSLAPGTTSFEGAILVAPLANDDTDVDGLPALGADLVVTVTARDVASGLTTDTASASGVVDVDVDAVVDPITNAAGDSSAQENTAGERIVSLNLTGIGLTDTDGSEAFTSLSFDLSVATASDDFDVSRDLGVAFSDPTFAGYLDISLMPLSDTTATVTILPAAGVTTVQFTEALAGLSVTFPQHFSGVMSLDGTLEWAELNLSGQEYDLGDNAAQQQFSITQTVAPVAEAVLNAAAFVLRAGEVGTGSAQMISGSADGGSVTVADILTLLESTDDGSSPAGESNPADGQVQLFVAVEAATPDTDGSEELETLLIHNIPTDWIADHVGGGGVVDRGAFFGTDGTSPLGDGEWAKVETAIYDDVTGTLTVNFVPDVTEFEASLELLPSLYEDYDVDRSDGDPYSATGAFFGEDLEIELTSRDTNTATEDSQGADVTLDVDVDPVNNFAIISFPIVGNEQEIDDAGGVFAFAIVPELGDQDGSEQITALVLRNVPSSMTVYVPDTENPTGPKVPALITALNSPPGFNTWSLEANYDTGVIQWSDVEIRGIPTHFAGDVAASVDVVTTEDDGATRVTNSSVSIRVEPVADGGDPSEVAETREDTAVQVVIDGNIIDNSSNSPGSPEAIYNVVRLENIPVDAFGRAPRFFDGDPAAGGIELSPTAGHLLLTPAEAQNLWVLPGQDSNETLQFDVTIVYYETIEPTETLQATGTVTISVQGIADVPIVEVQMSDPADPSNPTIAEAEVDESYKAGDGYRYELIYGYAGYANSVFRLEQTLSEAAVRNGYGNVSAGSEFDAATPLAGQMTEITDASGNYDGSETIYYFITGVQPGTLFVGGTPVDETGETYLVPGDRLADLEFVSGSVTQVTYHEMQLHAIVLEDDQEIGTLPGPDANANLTYLDSLPGGAVVTTDFTIVVLPVSGGEDLPCGDNQKLPTPTLSLVGSGDEDTEIAFQIKMEAVPGFYDSINDLVNLPNGVVGSFTLAIDLPPGATLSSDPSGAVFIDPASGKWVVDLGKLGVDPGDPTMTAGSILFTPPGHQSSPENPFDPDDTLGADDPYDSLDQLTFSTELINVNCRTTQSTTGAFDINITPIADGPDITLTGAAAFDEDTTYELGVEIKEIDGGERLVGDVQVRLIGGGTEGARLFLEDGTEVDASGGVFYVAPEDLDGLFLTATENFGGDSMQIRVAATTEDINGSTKTNAINRTVFVNAVADVPVFNYDDTLTDPDSGLPYIDVNQAVPVLTIIEDIPFLGFDVVQPATPDQDGSETTSIVLDLSNAPGLTVTGPTGSGFIDNGDGTYTISQTAYSSVFLSLDPEHARTPDDINGLPSEFPVTVTIQTLELSNADTNSASRDFLVRVRPDADIPGLDGQISPETGVEDDGQSYRITLGGTTPDPHEQMEFQITLPVDESGTPLGEIRLDGVALEPEDGVVTIPAAGAGGPGVVLLPDGIVTYVPPADFGGDVSLSVVAVSIDSTDAGAIYLDTEESEPLQLELTIAPTPDLQVTVETPSVQLQETDAALVYAPTNDVTIEVTDLDGSEEVNSVTYTLNGVPDGTSWTSGARMASATGGILAFEGSLAEFQTLEISFPANFASNGTPITGTISVTTNEGGSEAGSFEITVNGELDLAVTAQNSIPIAETGAAIVVEFGIETEILPDPISNTWETLEEVVVAFGRILPAGVSASAGTFNAARDTLTYTRGTTDAATFAAMVAALSVTLPAGTATALDGLITVSTNHGSSVPQSFEVELNSAPVPGPEQSFDLFGQTGYTIAASDLLTGTSDAEGDGFALSNPTSDDPDVSLSLNAEGDIEVGVPAGYAGTPVLRFDIVDDGTPSASASASAVLNIDTLQMVATGSSDTDGRDILSEVTGQSGGADIAKGTNGDDAVSVDLARPYTDIEGFTLLGGDDLIDLSGAPTGFTVDGGTGKDVVVGSSFADTLSGGLGADTLTGGTGADVFSLGDLTVADVITDYTTGEDTIDLSILVRLGAAEDVADRVDYAATTGGLEVDGITVAQLNAPGGALPPSVEIIFEDAAGQQQSAVM